MAVAESASPAVVTLTVGSAGQGGFGPNSVPSTGVGSGFVFDASGLILTNAHVIEGSDQIVATLKDGTELPGTVVATDTKLDLAVVKVVPAAALPTIPIGDASALKVGQQVIAIGSPLGTFTESVTAGILSATGRTIEVGSEASRRTTTMSGLLQTDAADQPRQQRRTAARRHGRRHRCQCRRGAGRGGPRLRDPDRRRGRHHGPGQGQGRGRVGGSVRGPLRAPLTPRTPPRTGAAGLLPGTPPNAPLPER